MAAIEPRLTRGHSGRWGLKGAANVLRKGHNLTEQPGLEWAAIPKAHPGKCSQGSPPPSCEASAIWLK